MANAIASHIKIKTQELNEAIIALGIVVELYMASSMRDIDDMIFIVNYLYGKIKILSDELNTMAWEGEHDSN